MTRMERCMKSSFPLFLAVTAASVLLACGYHVAKRSAAIPAWMTNVYIEPFENNSNELMLGAWITDALRQEFLRSSRFVLTTRDRAHVIIKGKVEEVESKGLSYVRYDLAVERRVRVKISFDLVDAATGQSIWGGGILEREEAFLVGKDVMKTQGLMNEALRKLSEDLSEILYHRVEGVY